MFFDDSNYERRKYVMLNAWIVCEDKDGL
jgi:hypothetical protein